LIKDFFTKGHIRSIEAKRNIATSFFIKSISIIINLALVPLTINYVKPTQYGIWITLSSIIAWFSFFDIGFGNGLRNRFAEAKAVGNYEMARIYVSTTYAVITIIFIIVWILFFVGNSFVNWSKILNAPTEMGAELSTLAIIVFSFFCLQMVLKTINTILIADQKPAKSSFLDMLGQLISLVIIFILTKTTRGSLILLGLSLGFAPIIILIISSIWFYFGKYKYFVPSFRHVKLSYSKDIMSLGIKFFLLQISAIIIFQTTNIVILQILSPEKVTSFNIAFKYFSILSLTFMIILTPLWSAFTEAYTKKDYEWMQRSIKKLKDIWLLLLPISLIMIFVAKSAYKLWVGESIIISLPTSILMSIYVLLTIRLNLFIYLINGIGKIKLQLYINLSICLVYIPMAIYACNGYGINGIIFVNIIVAIIHAILGQIQITRLMNNNAIGIWNK
jgi:O-antigen/teichoic acid export membrane protein